MSESRKFASITGPVSCYIELSGVDSNDQFSELTQTFEIFANRDRLTSFENTPTGNAGWLSEVRYGQSRRLEICP